MQKIQDTDEFLHLGYQHCLQLGNTRSCEVGAVAVHCYVTFGTAAYAASNKTECCGGPENVAFSLASPGNSRD
jgi:hypothetical protein